MALKIDRYFTKPGDDVAEVFAMFDWRRQDCVIRNPDGTEVFRRNDVEVPATWSEGAADIFARLYCRKRGGSLGDKGETSAKQVCGRIVLAIAQAGAVQEHLDHDEQDSLKAFRAELLYLMLSQRIAFNSPVWFNVGLWEEYGIEGKGDDWAWDGEQNMAVRVENIYARPRASACFLHGVKDDLLDIFDAIKREAIIFRSGSGVGANMSKLRGCRERLSGGGTSSGVMSFLDVFDAAAGSLKSGGTTRRAATMRMLDDDHPDIFEFVTWKKREEDKARALIREGYPADFNGAAYATVGGQNSNNSVMASDRFLKAVEEGMHWPLLARTTGEPIETVLATKLWDAIAESAWACADPGVAFRDTINRWNTVKQWGPIDTCNPCFTGEMLVDTTEGRISFARLAEMDAAGLPLPKAHGYDTETGQAEARPIVRAWATRKTTDLVRVVTARGTCLTCTPDHEFLLQDGVYAPARSLQEGTQLRALASCPGDTSGENTVRTFDVVASVTPVALGEAVEVFDITVEDIHSFGVTAPDSTSPITVVVSNCGEFWHPNSTACNLLCHNVRRYLDDATGTFDTTGFSHAARLGFIAQDILVDYASYPSREIAENSHKLRPLGQGYAGMGALFMALGLPYDSDRARGWCSAITALMHATCCNTSAEMASDPSLGRFAAYDENRHSMVGVIYQHVLEFNHFQDRIMPWEMGYSDPLNRVARAATEAMDALHTWSREHATSGFRNAQMTLLMPAGTVGLVMDCSTTGIEPEYALVKTKTLAGGGTMQYVNQDVPSGLRRLGYGPDDVETLMKHLCGTHKLRHFGAFDLLRRDATAGLSIGAIDNAREAAKTAPSLDATFARHVVGEKEYDAIVGPWKGKGGGGRLLLLSCGWGSEQIDALQTEVFGHGTFEGHPLATPEMLAVFDCAATNGDGERYIDIDAHLTMMAAAQPFLSGGISKTVSLPETATVEDIKGVYKRAHTLGLKAVALYRNNSKGSQPLTAGTAKSEAAAPPEPAPSPVEAQDDDEDEDLRQHEDLRQREGESQEAWDKRTRCFTCETCNARVSWSDGGPEDNDCSACWSKKHPDGVGDAEKAQRSQTGQRVGCPKGMTLHKSDGCVSSGPPPEPPRHKLARPAVGVTYKLEVDGQSLYLTTGCYPDGRLGEVFLTIQKAGGQLAGFVDSLAKGMSVGLQSGITLETYVKMYAHMRFEPAGLVRGHAHVKMCSSIADLVVRVLAADYLGDHTLSNVKPAGVDEDMPALSSEEDEAIRPTSPHASIMESYATALPRSARPRMPADTRQCAVCRGVARRKGACFTCDSCGHQDGCG